MDATATIKVISSSLGNYYSSTSKQSIIQSQSCLKCSSIISSPNRSRALNLSEPLNYIIAVNFTNAAIDGNPDGLEWARAITKCSANGNVAIDVIYDINDAKHDDQSASRSNKYLST
jgi:hypothetical protein